MDLDHECFFGCLVAKKVKCLRTSMHLWSKVIIFFKFRSFNQYVKNPTRSYREFDNEAHYFGSLECQQKLSMGLEKGYVHVVQVWTFVFLPLEWILNLEVSLHSLQHVKTEVQNCAFFGDLSTASTKYLRLWRPASKFKIHSKGKKTNANT